MPAAARRRRLQSTGRGQICASRPRRGSARGHGRRVSPHRVAEARDEPDPPDARDEALLAGVPLQHEQGADRVPAREAGRRQRLDRRQLRQRRRASSSPSGPQAAGSRSSGTGATTRATSSPTATTVRGCASTCARRRSSCPNPIRVDTKRPRIKVVSVKPRVFSPDGDRRSDRVTVRYTVDERARRDALRRRSAARRRREPQARRRAAVVREGRRQVAAGPALRAVGRRRRSSPGTVGPCRRRARCGSATSSSPRPSYAPRPGGIVRVRVLTDAAACQVAARQADRRREDAGLPCPRSAAERPLQPRRHRERPSRRGQRWS